jgi:hypothetical protein
MCVTPWVAYNRAMAIRVEAGSPQLDFAYLENFQTELLHAAPAPGIDEVRRRLSKIPGSMAMDFIAEREER